MKGSEARTQPTRSEGPISLLREPIVTMGPLGAYVASGGGGEPSSTNIRQTPVLSANGGDIGLERFPLTLKLEFLQHSGSFKVRGAFTNLLTRQVPRLWSHLGRSHESVLSWVTRFLAR